MSPPAKDRPADLVTGTLESALYAKDLDEAHGFYGGILGLEVIGRVPGRHVFYRVGESVLLIFNADATSRPPARQSRLPVPPHGATGPGHYCFAVPGDLLDRLRDALVAAGVVIEQQVVWPGGARSFYARDPAGNSIEFADPALWAAEGRNEKAAQTRRPVP